MYGTMFRKRLLSLGISCDPTFLLKAHWYLQLLPTYLCSCVTILFRYLGFEYINEFRCPPSIHIIPTRKSSYHKLQLHSITKNCALFKSQIQIHKHTGKSKSLYNATFLYIFFYIQSKCLTHLYTFIRVHCACLSNKMIHV